MLDLVREFALAVTGSASAINYGSGQLLVLPWALGDGESVTIYVEQIAEDLFHLSDRGSVASALALAEVELERPSGRQPERPTAR